MTFYQKMLPLLSPESVELVEERAAILEYDAGLPRPVAEAYAVFTVVDSGQAEKRTVAAPQAEPTLPGLHRPAQMPD